MRTQYELDDGILDAKMKVLHKLKDFVKIKETLTAEVLTISQASQVDFKELWDWTAEQMFSEQNFVEVKPTTPVVENVSGKYELVNRNVIRKPKSEPSVKPDEPEPKKETVFKTAPIESRVETVRVTKDTEILAWGAVDSNRFVRTEAVKNSKMPQALLQNAVLKDANLKVKRIPTVNWVMKRRPDA